MVVTVEEVMKHLKRAPDDAEFSDPFVFRDCRRQAWRSMTRVGGNYRHHMQATNLLSQVIILTRAITAHAHMLPRRFVASP